MEWHKKADASKMLNVCLLLPLKLTTKNINANSVLFPVYLPILTLFMSIAWPKGISGFQVRLSFWTFRGSEWFWFLPSWEQIRKVSMLCFRRNSFLSRPWPSSVLYVVPKQSSVALEMWIRLYKWNDKHGLCIIPTQVKTGLVLWAYFGYTHPGIPPASSMLAMLTSQDQTSNCHFCKPRTPQRTDPEWIPILMSKSKFSCLWTSLALLKQWSF